MLECEISLTTMYNLTRHIFRNDQTCSKWCKVKGGSLNGDELCLPGLRRA